MKENTKFVIKAMMAHFVSYLICGLLFANLFNYKELFELDNHFYQILKYKVLFSLKNVQLTYQMMK